jgi:hypothetical protein
MNNFNRGFGRTSFLSSFVPIFISVVGILTLAGIIVVIIVGIKVVNNPEATVEGIGKLVKIFIDAVGGK